MTLLEIILIGVSLSMDAFAVSIGKGLSVPRTTGRQALCVALWFGGFQALMPLVGYALGSAFAGLITSVDHWIAFALLALIGGNMIREAVKEAREAAAGKDEGKAESADAGADANPKSDAASFAPKVMLLLAIATSIDALAVGINFAFLQVNIWLSVAIIGCITAGFSVLGLKFGNALGAKFQTKAQILGGIVLICIGLKILIEHLFFG